MAKLSTVIPCRCTGRSKSVLPSPPQNKENKSPTICMIFWILTSTLVQAAIWWRPEEFAGKLPDGPESLWLWEVPVFTFGHFWKECSRGLAVLRTFESVSIKLAAVRDWTSCTVFLLKKDPQAAGRIQPADRVRIIRSLEVYLLTGSPISQLQQQREPLENFSILKIGLDLPRPDLYDRIDRRVSEMFGRGLVQEVQELLDRDYSPDCQGFKALGYRHAVAALRGELSQEEAITRTQVDTRRYAKRQLTWFRREEEVHWIPGPGEDPSTLQQLLKLVEDRR